MTKEEKKALYDILAPAYVKAYKRDEAFYHLGKETGVYLEFEDEAADSALEKALNYLFPNMDIVGALCEFASKDEVVLMSKDCTVSTYTDLEGIWNVYTE